MHALKFHKFDEELGYCPQVFQLEGVVDLCGWTWIKVQTFTSVGKDHVVVNWHYKILCVYNYPFKPSTP